MNNTEGLARRLYPPWVVYSLVNHTRREIYTGIAQGAVSNRWEDHVNDEVKATMSWEWGSDRIDGKILDWCDTREEASQFAHLREGLLPDYEGYSVIQTGGW